MCVTYIGLDTNNRWDFPTENVTTGIYRISATPDHVDVHAVSSSQLGCFWLRPDDGTLLVSEQVDDLLTATAVAPELDEEFLRAFHVRDANFLPALGHRSPFLGIQRIPPGSNARFLPGQPEPVLHTPWSTIDRDHPWIEGPSTPELYLRTFDRVLDSLVEQGPVSATLSGGLDSTFVVGSLALKDDLAGPIHAYCHSPHPDAPIDAGTRIADDYSRAQTMVDYHPGKIILHRVFPENGDNPLDAAEYSSRQSWLPVNNPANAAWMTRIGQLASEQGSSQLFIGARGNATFSASHGYAPWYYVRQGQLARAWKSNRRLSSGSDNALAVATRLPRSRLRLLLNKTTNSSDYLRYLGIPGAPRYRLPLADRHTYLHHLLAGTAYPGGGFATGGIKPIDPFTAPELIRLAASITPLEWTKGPSPRGYARLLAQGRVPDDIRLSTTRGGQGLDQWYLMRNMRDRYHDELALLPDTPVLGGWIDDQILRETVDSLPWGEPQCSQTLAITALNRTLSLAAYIRMVDQRLRRTPATN